MARPTKIDQVIRHTDPKDGSDPQPVTVAQAIVASLRTGNYLETAAAAAGVHKDTVYGWLKTAANARAAREAARAEGRTPKRLTKLEALCIEFSDAVDEAQATWEVHANTVLEQLGRGGIEQVTVTEKVQVVHEDDGNGGRRQVELPMERTTRRDTTLPDAATLRWRLERKFPKRYGKRVAVEGVEEGAPITVEQRAANLAEMLAAFRASTGRDTEPQESPA